MNMQCHTDLEITERFGHEWTNELISVDWPHDTPASVLVDGKPAPSQQHCGKVWFPIAQLPPHETLQCRVVAEENDAGPPCAAATPDGDTMILSNRVLELRVPAARGIATAGEPLPGPWLAVRVADGNWIGHGHLYHCQDQPITAIEFDILAEGPLWCTYVVRYVADHRGYEVAYRLDHNADYVRMSEHSHLGHDATWEFDVYPGLKPRQGAFGHHRTGQRTKLIELEYDGNQHLGAVQAPEQSIHYFADDFDAYAFLGREQALGLATLQDGDWTFAPENPIELLPESGPRLRWQASCKAGQRHWLLHLGTPDKYDHEAFAETPLGRLRRKFETTLDWVKDLVLEWPELDVGARPHAVCTKDDLERARHLFQDFEPLRRYGEYIDRTAPLVLGQYNAGGHYPMTDEHREDPISAWLMQPDEEVATIIKRGLLAGIRSRVDAFLGPMGHRNSGIGAINLGRLLRPFVQIYDLLGEHLPFSDAERTEFKACAAFLCCKINDRNYWNADGITLHSDHPRSYHRTAWFPHRESDWTTYNVDTAPHNFHIDVYTAMGCAAMTFPQHPEANRWLEQCLTWTECELDNWIFPTGAFIESATYTLATLHWWVPYFASLKHIGRRDYFQDERLQRMCRCLVRVLGPHDRRIERRSFTVMGDAMYPSGAGDVLAWLAHLSRDDAELSALLAGAWQGTGRQLNNPGQQGLSMYDAIYIDPDLPAAAPSNLPSEHVEGLGLILRSQQGNPENEVFFFIKCGKIYSHFHHDEGAFFFFADGVPIMDEYGIQYGSGTDENGEEIPGHAPRLHNAISFSETPTDRECYNRGFVSKFQTTPLADYAVCEMPIHLLHMQEGMSLWGFTGEEAPTGWWRRHILFVKPHAFFFHDQLETEFGATLDLNFKATDFVAKGPLQRVYQGRYGADIPVCINLPTNPELIEHTLDMQANDNAFPKFSTMEKVDPGLHRDFYKQVSWHVQTGPNTDFNWAIAWAKPEAKASLAPLGRGLPGARLQIHDAVTEAIISPWLEPACAASNETWVYAGRAGAVRRHAEGRVELIQMNGNRIGLPDGPVIRGDGPFVATIDRERVTVDGAVNGKNIRVENAGNRQVEIARNK